MAHVLFGADYVILMLHIWRIGFKAKRSDFMALKIFFAQKILPQESSINLSVVKGG